MLEFNGVDFELKYRPDILDLLEKNATLSYVLEYFKTVHRITPPNTIAILEANGITFPQARHKYSTEERKLMLQELSTTNLVSWGVTNGVQMGYEA